MIGSRKRRSIARLLVAAALFVQAAFALAACELADRNPVQAIAESSHPCHQPETSTNLCVSHCLASDQSLDKPKVFVPALALGTPLVVARDSAPLAPVDAIRETARPVAGPPPRILFHSFLI